MSDAAPSANGTPNPRFASQGHATEDLLKEQTVGLVHLSDFRKRRAEVQEQSDNTSGAATPDGRESASKTAFKKRKKGVKKGGLSFGDDEEEEAQSSAPSVATTPALESRANTPGDDASTAPPTDSETNPAPTLKKRLKPNSAVNFQPKALTKSALARDAQVKEQLRREYMQIQEGVKQTEFCLPFVFFDGKDRPGGMCRVKKGDFVWLFLERARKVGANMAGRGDATKRDWARIGVDDLMVVRGDLIIPHHYDFHYFMVNHTVGYKDTTIFAHSAEPTPSTPKHLLPEDKNASNSSDEPAGGLSTAAGRARQREAAVDTVIPDSDLEGFHDDPALTKVVDRRWYERNKHIYPASVWEDFDPERDYSQGPRKDGEGNAFFFSR